MSKEKVRDWKPDANAGEGRGSNLITEEAPLPEFMPVNKPAPYSKPDEWSDARKAELIRCLNCTYYLNTRCRRHAPVSTIGYPMVYESDWCGDMKPTKRSMGGH